MPRKNLIYLQGKPIPKTEIDRINNIPYKLQIDDVISINIQSADEKLVSMFQKRGQSSGNNQGLSGYSVDSYGNIRVPYLGEINVLGYTEVEVREKIEKELWKLFKNKDDVFVSVKLSGIKYTIFGEIASPGQKVINQNKVSIIEAIANSGDITAFGNRKKVEIIRNAITGIEKFTIDLTDIKAFDSNVFYIKPNDYINVIPLRQKSWGVGTTGLQSLSTIVSVFTLITSTLIIARNL